MSPASLSRIWKQDGWIRRLSGLMLEPSTAKAGVAKLIASLPDTPASRSASRDASEPTKTPATCGRTLPALSASANHAGAFSKMLPTIYRWDLNRFVMTWATWVTKLRQACLARKKWVRRTAASGCLSSLNWATPNTMDHLPQRSTAAMQRLMGKGGQREGRSRPSNLREQILWPSPRAQEPGSTSSGHGNALGETAKAWPTPLSRDWKDTPNDKGGRQESVAEAAFHFGRHTHATLPDGKPFPMSLNPAFTEWLMGWPIGWTESEPAVTGWCRWQQDMRGALSALVLMREDYERFTNSALPA
jgi:hypothetical protein